MENCYSLFISRATERVERKDRQRVWRKRKVNTAGVIKIWHLFLICLQTHLLLEWMYVLEKESDRERERRLCFWIFDRVAVAAAAAMREIREGKPFSCFFSALHKSLWSIPTLIISSKGSVCIYTCVCVWDTKWSKYIRWVGQNPSRRERHGSV